jgi:hypothetical protein
VRSGRVDGDDDQVKDEGDSGKYSREYGEGNGNPEEWLFPLAEGGNVVFILLATGEGVGVGE